MIVLDTILFSESEAIFSGPQQDIKTSTYIATKYCRLVSVPYDYTLDGLSIN